ncbi:MAG: hypothetical protein AAGE18_03665 [Pseudomonadota bacterium]
MADPGRSIAIIGWGSLIWDLEVLAPHVTGDWAMTAGPVLPLEFSRISAKRKMGLVVCIDPAVGVDCPTHVIRSRRGRLADAAADLAARERAPLDLIGAVDIAGDSAGRAEIAALVAGWCRRTGWDGAVWTDLRPNFAETTGQTFSLQAAQAYLRTLAGENLEEAHRYIQNAPAGTQTPLRQALAADGWWQGLSPG